MVTVKSKMIAELNIKPFQAVLSDYSGFRLTENGSVKSGERLLYDLS